MDVHPEDCTLDLDDLRRQLSPRTRLLAVTAASNLVGTLNDIPTLVRLGHAVGAKVFVDAVHYAPHGPMDVQAWDCDFLACSAYKFFGPHVGVLWGRRRWLEELEPYKVRPAADTLPERWMTGTQNHEGLAGVAAAVAYLAAIDPRGLRQSMAVIQAYERELAGRLLAGLAERRRFKVWGITDPARLGQRVPTVSITAADRSPADIAHHLAERSCYVWNGNMYGLELSERLGLEETGGLLRIGLVHYNTAAEVDRLLRRLDELWRCPPPEVGGGAPADWRAGSVSDRSPPLRSLTLPARQNPLAHPVGGTPVDFGGASRLYYPAMRRLQYAITGTGRSGTVYLANLLTSAALPCGHESIFTPWGYREAGPSGRPGAGLRQFHLARSLRRLAAEHGRTGRRLQLHGRPLSRQRPPGGHAHHSCRAPSAASYQFVCRRPGLLSGAVPDGRLARVHLQPLAGVATALASTGAGRSLLRPLESDDRAAGARPGASLPDHEDGTSRLLRHLGVRGVDPRLLQARRSTHAWRARAATPTRTSRRAWPETSCLRSPTVTVTRCHRPIIPAAACAQGAAASAARWCVRNCETIPSAICREATRARALSRHPSGKLASLFFQFSLSPCNGSRNPLRSKYVYLEGVSSRRGSTRFPSRTRAS